MVDRDTRISQLAKSAELHQAQRLVVKEPKRLEAYTLEIDMIEKLKRIFKIARHMDEVRSGELHELSKIRRGDYLHECWLTFKEMHNTLRKNTEDEIALLARAIKAAEGVLADSEGAKDVLTQSVNEMRELEQKKQASLDP